MGSRGLRDEPLAISTHAPVKERLFGDQFLFVHIEFQLTLL